MAINTCSELIIHVGFKLYHLNATHSNISFGIALRNIANKRSSFHKQSISDNNISLSEEPTFVVQPISVASPSSEATLNLHVVFIVPAHMDTSNSDAEDVVQTHQVLNSSLPFVLESIHEPAFVPISATTTEILRTNEPSSSSQITPQPITTTVSPPPTLLLDSTILKEVCENILKEV